jgi:hypothetical protein
VPLDLTCTPPSLPHCGGAAAAHTPHHMRSMPSRRPVWLSCSGWMAILRCDLLAARACGHCSVAPVAEWRSGAAAQAEALENAFKNETVGLVTKAEFMSRRSTLAERLGEETRRAKREVEDSASLVRRRFPFMD